MMNYMDNSAKKTAKIKALKNDSGLQQLINEAYKILGNPMVVHDMEYKLVAYTENVVTSDPLFNELVTTGRFCDESVEFFRNEEFIDTVANMDNTAFLVSDKLAHERIVGKIYNKDNITVANACIVSTNKKFEDGDHLVFEALCKKISKQFGKTEFYQTYGTVYQENIIGKLLDGNINDKTLYSGHIANIYAGLKNNLYLVVVDLNQSGADYDKLVRFRDLFKQTQNSFEYVIYSKYIIFIISFSAVNPNIKKSLHKLTRIFEQNNMYVGISRSFENLFNLRKYYLEALGALDYGLKNDKKRRIFLYNEIFENFSKNV